MKHYTYLLISSFLLLALPSSALSQLYECDGVWTNQPCKGGTEQVIEEIKREPRSEQAIEKDKRSSALHDLEMLRLKVNRENNTNINIDGVRRFCNNASNSLEDCKDKVSKKENEINELLLSKEESEPKKTETENDETETIIVDGVNRTPYDRRRRRKEHRENIKNETPKQLPTQPIKRPIKRPRR